MAHLDYCPRVQSVPLSVSKQSFLLQPEGPSKTWIPCGSPPRLTKHQALSMADEPLPDQLILNSGYARNTWGASVLPRSRACSQRWGSGMLANFHRLQAWFLQTALLYATWPGSVVWYTSTWAQICAPLKKPCHLEPWALLVYDWHNAGKSAIALKHSRKVQFL